MTVELQMSPDLYFALTLTVKMVVTAGFVLAATVTAERVGPLLGGLVATLPIGAGPVYVFLAIDHDAHFIAQSAIASLAINAVNVIFAICYALLAQTRSRAISMALAFLVWLVLASIVSCGQLDVCQRRGGRTSLFWAFACGWRGHCATCAWRAFARAGPIWRCAPAWSLCWSAWS